MGSVTECACATTVNAKEPDRERCTIVCGAEIHKDWVKCRPCAMGNHTGAPCPQYKPDWPRTLIPTCRDCGFDSADHERGSDGQPN